MPAHSLPAPPTDGRLLQEGAVRAEDPDLQVVRRIRAGDRDAYRTLVERHQRKVFNLAGRILGCDRDLAADHSQEIFLKAYRGLGSFREESKFSTYLHQVALNHCISEIRKRRAAKRGEALSLDAPVSWKGEEGSRQVPDRTHDPVRSAASREIASALRAALASLEDDLRLLVVLFDVEGLSYPEIAGIAGIPIGTVRSRLHRAREILREKLRSHLG